MFIMKGFITFYSSFKFFQDLKRCKEWVRDNNWSLQ